MPLTLEKLQELLAYLVPAPFNGCLRHVGLFAPGAKLDYGRATPASQLPARLQNGKAKREAQAEGAMYMSEELQLGCSDTDGTIADAAGLREPFFARAEATWFRRIRRYGRLRHLHYRPEENSA